MLYKFHVNWKNILLSTSDRKQNLVILFIYFVVDLFNYIVSVSEYVMLNSRLLMNDELEGVM
jgi:hypothetical protein